MVNFTNLEKISLKNHPEINEAMIEEYLEKNPKALGLGGLEFRQKQKIYPNAGRLDLLFSDENDETRYEVEIQLGATDPSHIIRTIEYWDNERKRQPQYEHCAVIIAEDITSRFFNVISLFNGAIPLIAIQLSAYKTENGIQLAFTKVLSRPVFEDENGLEVEVRDRDYWTHKSTPKMIDVVDSIFSDLSEHLSGCELKYNKNYIGIQRNGIAKNFISFVPKKAFLYINARGQEDQELVDSLENAGVETRYDGNSGYRIRINRIDDYWDNKDDIVKLVKMSMERFGIED